METYDWTYKGFEFTDSDIGNNIGFVYLITNKANGMKYIGKKHFYSTTMQKVIKKSAKAKKGKLSKKVKDLTPDEQEARKKSIKVTKPSDWKGYFGSSEELKEDLKKYGKSAFTREILQLVDRRGLLSYYELKHQLAEDACLRPDFYNGILNVRLNRNIFPKDARDAAMELALATNQEYKNFRMAANPRDFEDSVEQLEEQDNYEYECG